MTQRIRSLVLVVALALVSGGAQAGGCLMWADGSAAMYYIETSQALCETIYDENNTVLWLEGGIADLLSNNVLALGDFDPESFELGFGGVIILWVAGLSIGLIIGVVRKAKRN